MKRRNFLVGTGATLAAPALSRTSSAGLAGVGFPFSVASGDPTADGIILWTRLARSSDDLSLVADTPIAVEWLLASDEHLSRIVRRGIAIATPEWGHSVHVDVAGLEPDRTYWYAFRLGNQISPIGRTRTLPAANAALSRFRFNLVCCQHWEQGYFDAYDGMAEDDAAFVLHLGDYIYDANRGAPVRAHETPAEPQTLAEYRRRHALYRGDAALRRAHERMPFLLMPDNHDTLADGSDDPASLRRRAASYQAWYEFLPVRYAPALSSPTMQILRGLDIGRLMRISLPDTRQYRDSVSVCVDGSDKDFAFGVFQNACTASRAQDRSMLGKAQAFWLDERLSQSPARWNVLASTVMMTPLDMRHNNEVYRYLQSWDGYPAERTRILDRIAASHVANPIALGGDIHAAVVSEVVRQAGETPSRGVMSEFVTTSISSLCPEPMARPIRDALPANPHIRHCDTAKRGYMRCTVTDKAWTTDLRTIDIIERPGGKVTTDRSFVVENGRLGVQPA